MIDMIVVFQKDKLYSCVDNVNLWPTKETEDIFDLIDIVWCPIMTDNGTWIQLIN